jgi:hypothetical protein
MPDPAIGQQARRGEQSGSHDAAGRRAPDDRVVAWHVLGEHRQSGEQRVLDGHHHDARDEQKVPAGVVAAEPAEEDGGDEDQD